MENEGGHYETMYSKGAEWKDGISKCTNIG